MRAWGCSSVGRARRSQCRGQGFEPPHLHHNFIIPQIEGVSAIHTRHAVDRTFLSLIHCAKCAKGSMMSRRCNKCGVVASDDAFYAATERGITRLRAICKQCSKAQLHDHSGEMKPEGLRCAQCGVYKPLSEFHTHRSCRYGVEPTCKTCRLEKRRQYSRDHPDRVRNTDLQTRYGITLEQYHAMVAAQAGQCAICDKVEKKLVVDHNHATGQVRGLLCHLCNTMIGCARENINVLARAAAYLHIERQAESGLVGAEVIFTPEKS